MSTKYLRIALYIAFLVCLYVSIPHLAWVFHSWDSGSETPFQLSVADWDVLSTSKEWFNSYLEAMSIDIIIALLSITLTNSDKVNDKRIGYVFITLLIGISWLFNWAFAQAHAPHLSGIWDQQFGFWILQINVATITPVITSALPVFALAFTIMIDKLTGQEITVEDLRTHLAAKQKLAEVRKEFAGNKTESIKETLDNATAIAGYAAGKLPKIKLFSRKKNEDKSQETEQETGTNPTRNGKETTGEIERNTDAIQIPIDEETGEESRRKAGGKPEESPMENGEENMASWLASCGSTVSLLEVVQRTKLSRKLLNNRVERKEIRCTKNKDIVYVDSLKLWMKNNGYLGKRTITVDLKPKETESVSSQIPAGEIDGNDEESGPESLDKMQVTLAALETDRNVTDEKLAEILNLKRPASARFWKLRALEILAVNERNAQE